jgi:hypothetical protein
MTTSATSASKTTSALYFEEYGFLRVVGKPKVPYALHSKNMLLQILLPQPET